MLVVAAALVVPHAVLFWGYRTSWWAAGIATAYYGVAASVVGDSLEQGRLTQAESELLFAAVGLPWLVLVATVVVGKVRARRRLRTIQTFLDANPVPDTIPDWVAGGTAAAPAPGIAGRSARRAAGRRQQRGSTTAARWEKGAEGEERVGRWLNELHGNGFYVLHDRRLPGSKANIDHLVVSPAGVWVIDAKNYSGQPQMEGDDGDGEATAFRIDGYSKRDLVDGVRRQVDAVRQAVGGALTAPGVDVRGLLCFVGPTSELLVRPFAIDGVGVAWPGVVLALLRRTPGPLTDAEMRAVAHRLENGLPEAVAAGRRRAG